MIKKILKWLWKGNADESIEQKEYESMAAMIEEFGEEKEQKELDVVFDKLEENEEACSKIQESSEAIQPISFKINDSEDGNLFSDILQIDGAVLI